MASSRDKKKVPEAQTVKTSVRLPRDLWREARILAMDENTELQIIVTRALEAYLKQRGGKR